MTIRTVPTAVRLVGTETADADTALAQVGDAKGAQAGRVCILMGLHNGTADLDDQLQSLADQSWGAWDLIVSDDGSSDTGPAKVRTFAKRMAPNRHVALIDGPRTGVVANYLGLIAQAPVTADWLALSDQDDVWLPDRLARGIDRLSALPAKIPAIYCTATLITDAQLGNRRASMPVPRDPGFRNALVQNIAAGNTILMNRAAADLARDVAPKAAQVPGLPVHDWWLYQLITGVGGTVIYDPEPSLLYRQHARNVIGANDGWRARWLRIRLLLAGRFAVWNSANVDALMLVAGRLTVENRATLNRFAAARSGSLWQRLRGFVGLGLYRQRLPGQIALWLAVLLRRV